MEQLNIKVHQRKERVQPRILFDDDGWDTPEDQIQAENEMCIRDRDIGSSAFPAKECRPGASAQLPFVRILSSTSSYDSAAVRSAAFRFSEPDSKTSSDPGKSSPCRCRGYAASSFHIPYDS